MPKSEKEFLVTEDQKERLKVAQEKFYAILKEQGFNDLENPNDQDGLLTNKIDLQNYHAKKAIKEEYQKMVDAFTNSELFETATLSMSKHGNCKLNQSDIKLIWERATQLGWPERKIAEDAQVSKSAIHYVLGGLRKWMSL